MAVEEFLKQNDMRDEQRINKVYCNLINMQLTVSYSPCVFIGKSFWVIGMWLLLQVKSDFTQSICYDLYYEVKDVSITKKRSNQSTAKVSKVVQSKLGTEVNQMVEQGMSCL